MRHWQDIVLAVGSLVFSIALIPSLRSKDKPAFATSVVTFLVLITFAITYMTLSFWFSTVAIAINALTWLVLAIQKRQRL